MIELRGELTKAEEEKAEAQAELAKMQTLGAQLQTALEKSQRELGQAEGNAAYYKVLLEESGKEAPTDWQSLRKGALEAQVEAARAEAARWRELAEQRGEELADLRARLAPPKDPGALAAIQAPEGQSPPVKVRLSRKLGKAGHPQYFDIFSPQDPRGKAEKSEVPTRRGSPRPRQLPMARRSCSEGLRPGEKAPSARNPLSATMAAR